QGVHRGVRGGVGRLSGGAERAGRGGEEHEGVEVEAAGELVQVQGGVRLGTEHRGQALGGEGGGDAVVDHARGVHDRAQRPFGGDAGDGAGEGVAVGDVARRDVHGGAFRRESGGELIGSGGVRAAPAEQEQVAHAVLADQVQG